MNKLAKITKDKEFLDICSKIIYSVPGTGLPLGYYTSQWFANYYLQSFDHYLREVLMPKYGMDFYIRYMDDMVILGPNKRKLNSLKNEIDEYLRKELKLWLKPNSSIFSVKDMSIDFIGYKFNYGYTTLRKRIINHLKLANDKLYSGKFTIKALSINNAYHGWLKSSKTRNYEANNLKGNRSIERLKYKELVNNQRDEYENSKTKLHTDRITQEIINLKITESGNDSVLVRYYQSTNSVKIVSRSVFRFPDEEEHRLAKIQEEERLKAEKEARKKNKPKRYNSKTGYYPSAEIYTSNNGAAYTKRLYNEEIRLTEELH